MMHFRNLTPFLIFFLLPSVFASTASEISRLKGFAEHQKEGKQFDAAREAGEIAFLEDEERWQNQMDRALRDYKSQKKEAKVSDDGPEAKQDQLQKEQWQESYEESRRACSKGKGTFDRSAYPDLVSEAKELGLDEERPRYDYRKRAVFGATSKYGKSGSASSSGSSFGGGGSFPPPPAFDDFQDGGYVPAPPMDDFGDIPPPPPPPPFSDDGGFGGGTFDGDFPPPPPPPPGFEDDF